jgi:hypothetical protein
MSVSFSTTPATTAERSNAWFGGSKRFALRQRVNPTHGSAFAALTINLPARTRVIWSRIYNQGATAVTGNDATSTANSLALVLHPTTATAPLTQPQTVTVSSPSGGTNGAIGLLSTDTAAAGVAAGPPRFETTAPLVNTGTTPALITLQPAFTNSNRLYANGTSGFVFGTSTAANTSYTGSVDVVLYCETFDDTPSF